MSLADELRQGLKNVSLKGGSLALERAGRLLLIVVSARVIGQASFGRFVFASTVTALLAQGTDLGLGAWTTRELARHRPDGEKVLRVALAIRGLASLPYGLAVATVAIFAASGEERVAVALLGVAALGNVFVDHFGAAHRGFERFGEEARLNTSRALLTTTLGLAAIVTTRSLAGLCVGLAVANVASSILGLVTLSRFHDLRTARVADSLDRPLARVALRESLPIWFAGLFAQAYFKVDTLFLRSFAGEAELGAYGAAYKFFEGALALPSVIMAVAFPRLARAHGDPIVQRRLERRLVVLLLGLGLFAAAACYFGAELLVRLAFGPGFGRAVDSLRVLALGLPILYVNFGLTHFLIARNLATTFTWFALMMLVCNVALDLLLIPGGSGPGAAWATLLTEVALTVCCLWALRAAATRELPSTRAAARTGPTAA
jgi:PST family polysaccharide transporter